ncbi:MAG: 50S ribosomal protein L13 [Clostridia bacterium]|nr:50S ribosomal protein L13 [Clostridia bacterium]
MDIKELCHVVDGTDLILGRLASNVANVLRGKNKPTYTPNVDCGDHVIVINCAKVRLTGKKLENKYHIHHTGYIGGLKEIQYKKLMAEKPEISVMLDVIGMIPKYSLGRMQLTKLRCYAGAEHNHEAQQPKELKF